MGVGGGEHPQIDAIAETSIDSPPQTLVTSLQVKHPAFIALTVQSALGHGAKGGHMQEFELLGGS